MIINDDCRINLILGEFIKSQSEEIPRQSTRNEKNNKYSLKYSKFRQIKLKITIPPIKGTDSFTSKFLMFFIKPTF